MPCRYFEPLEIVPTPFHPNARLPLIDEYDGLCHADSESAHVPAESRFAGCNHGNRDNPCGRFPSGSERVVLRLTVQKEDAESVEIVAIEEANHRPVRWQTVRFFRGTEELVPDVAEICRRAQVVAFCRSYLKRCSGPQELGQNA